MTEWSAPGIFAFTSPDGIHWDIAEGASELGPLPAYNITQRQDGPWVPYGPVVTLYNDFMSHDTLFKLGYYDGPVSTFYDPTAGLYRLFSRACGF